MEPTKSVVFREQDSLMSFSREDKRLTEIHICDAPDSLQYTRINNSSGATSTSGASFIIIPNSARDVIDRNIVQTIQGTVTYTFNALNPAGAVLNTITAAQKSTLLNGTGLKFCSRANPITSVCGSMSLQCGGTTINLPFPNYTASVLNRFNNDALEKATVQSISSCMYDRCIYTQDNADLAQGPFGSLIDVIPSESSVPPRTGGITVQFVSGADASAVCSVVVSFTVSEALPLPLLEADKTGAPGIYGFRQLNITQAYSTVSRIVQMYFNSADVTVQAAADGNPAVVARLKLMDVQAAIASNYVTVRTCTPQADVILPSTVRYACPYIDVRASESQIQLANFLGGANQSVSFPALTLPFVPRFIICWVPYVQPISDVQACTVADRLFPITGLTIIIGNRQIAITDPVQLYELSLASFMHCSYDEFVGRQCNRTGANGAAGPVTALNSFPMCVDMSLLTLQSGYAPGMRETINLAVSVNITNTSAEVAGQGVKTSYINGYTYPVNAAALTDDEVIPPTLQPYMMTITEGFVTSHNGEFVMSTGLFDKSEYLAAKQEVKQYERSKSGRLTGGDFLGTIGSIADTVGKVMPLLGLGEVGGEIVGRGLTSYGGEIVGRGLTSYGAGRVGGRALFK